MTRSDVGGYHGDEDAFAAYTAAVGPLGEQLRGLADRDLAPNGEFGDDAFSVIGGEVGLTQAIRAATQRQHQEVHGLADRASGTADAVRNTWTNMVGTEQDADAAVRRAAGEVS